MQRKLHVRTGKGSRPYWYFAPNDNLTRRRLTYIRLVRFRRMRECSFICISGMVRHRGQYGS
jgi:hypothetical protein